MGWFKGKSNKSDVKKQHNYDVAVWNFKRDTQNLQWKHADSAYNAQVKTNQQIRDFEYESQVRAYEDAAAIRDFDFANQRAAHNASVEAYNDQLDFNELAEQMVDKIQGPWIEPKNHDFSYPIEDRDKKFEQGEITYGEARPGEVKRFISNSDKMKSFGWKPKVDLEEGLEKYINWRKSL